MASVHWVHLEFLLSRFHLIAKGVQHILQLYAMNTIICSAIYIYPIHQLNSRYFQVKPWVLLCPLEACPCWLSASSAFWQSRPMRQLPYHHGVQTGAPICQAVLWNPHKICEGWRRMANVIPKYLMRILCVLSLMRIINHTWAQMYSVHSRGLVVFPWIFMNRHVLWTADCLVLWGCSTIGSKASISWHFAFAWTNGGFLILRNKLWQGNAEEFTLDLFNDEGVQRDWESNMSSRAIKTESKHRDTADMFGFTALKDSLESPPFVHLVTEGQHVIMSAIVWQRQ